MKKLGIILMVFCLTLSLLTVPALADGEKVITLTPTTGFIQEGIDDSAITASGYPFRTYKNWITVDVSDLAGTYSIDAVYKNNGVANYRHSALNLIIDGAVKTRIYTPSTGGWGNTATVSATVYIPAATQVMKIERIGAENVVLDSLTFNYLNAADTASEEIEIYAMNISLSDAPTTTKGVKNTDYYHAEASSASYGVVNGGNTPAIIHRGGRDDLYWSRYDISGVAPGLYEIELTRGCTGAASSEILIDGTSALTGTHAASGGSFTYTPETLGKVYIPAGAQYLTVKALTGAYYFHSFKLIPADYSTTVSFNAKTDGTTTNVDMTQSITAAGIPFRNGTGGYATFNLSDKYLQSGRYEIALTYKSNYNRTNDGFDIEVDGVDVLEENFGLLPTAGWVLCTEPAIGYINIAENAPQQLKLIYIDTVQALELVGITLTRVGDAVTPEPEAPLAVTYSTDAAGDNEIDTIGSNTSIYANISVNDVFDAAKVYVVHYNAANPECYVLTTAEVQDLADGLRIQVTGLGANSVVKTFIWDATTFIPLMDEVSIN